MHSESNAFVVTDIRQTEFSAGPGRALRHGGHSEFALLMSMLHRDATDSVQFTEEQPELKDSREAILEAIDFYPVTSLKTENHHFSIEHARAQALQRGDIAALKFQLHSHPTPLSLYNDHKHLPEEVVSNCDMYAQLRLQNQHKNNIEVDPTMLYDTVSEVHEMGLG